MEIKLDSSSPRNLSTAQAAVIGCSHSNNECDHQMHASTEAFFTIDIRSELEPDLCVDITKGSVPEDLKNKFQLTILEFLPFDVYNLNKASRAYFKIDGEVGWRNINELTHEDGFIMVVGNSTNFCYRSSLANLKFLELAQNEDFEASVILIPKNQNLTAAEVKEKIQNLPQELQDAIQIATTVKFQPLPSNDFCKLNYVPSKINAELIDILNQFHCVMQLIPNFYLDKELCKEIEAADALIEVLLGNAPESSLEAYQDALSGERLGDVIKSALGEKTISELIDTSNSARSFNEYKEKYAHIKQQHLAQDNAEDSFYYGLG